MKLFKQILREISLEEGSCTIGNSLYGMDKQISKLLIDGYRLIPVIPVKGEIRNGIRDTYRKRQKEIYENNKNIYRKRYTME